ncbi:hypothetical protein L9F63_013200, partial [Diploptera punctata]
LEGSYRKRLKVTDKHFFQSKRGCHYYYRLTEQGMLHLELISFWYDKVWHVALVDYIPLALKRRVSYLIP